MPLTCVPASNFVLSQDHKITGLVLIGPNPTNPLKSCLTLLLDKSKVSQETKNEWDDPDKAHHLLPHKWIGQSIFFKKTPLWYKHPEGTVLNHYGPDLSPTSDNDYMSIFNLFYRTK